MAGECFIIGGWDQFRAVSKDGAEWRHVSFKKDSSQTCSSIAFGGGRCAMLSNRGYFGNSYLEFTSDGQNWQSSEVKAGQVGHSVVYFNGRFMVCTGKTINTGHRPAIVATEDGKKWSKEVAVPGRSIMTHYAEGNDRLVGVGPNGMAASTKDGEKWSVAELDNAVSMISLAFANGLFIGGGLHGQVWRSEDGMAWEKVNAGDEGEHVNTMIWDGKKFLGLGLGATYISSDGRSWQRTPNENAPLTAVRGADGLYIGNQWKGRLLTSRDGIRWTQAAEFERHVETVGYGSLTGAV